MAVERRILPVCERIVFANAGLFTQSVAVTVIPTQGDVLVKETKATRMLSRMVDGDGLKVFCREGGTWPGLFDIEIDCVAAL